MRIALVRPFVALALGWPLVACRPQPADGTSVAPADTRDALAVSDALETDIEAGRGGDEQREQALARVRALPDDGSAGYAFARAAVAGRVAELRGAKAGKLVGEAEHFARLSRERDPEFRDRAATRMLGTLYVMAPARLVEHGDSEEGLEMLEQLAEEKPDDPRNRLRVGEAYVHLGDSDPARLHLCRAIDGRASLRRDEQKLLDALVEEAGGPAGLACDEGEGP